MASRLSSLLVRDGLVGVKRMEKAFQRQVIYGGSLDTILLEMNLVPEDRLAQYLALATGLPPATRTETNLFDAEAVKRCAEDVASRFRVVPLQLDAGALRVLVCDPVNLELLEDLADVLDTPVQPLIAPEYRWHVVFARAYDKQAPARFATLAKQAEVAPVMAPVGRSKTVIVEPQEPADHVVVDVVEDAAPLRATGPDAPTMRYAAQLGPDEETRPSQPRAITAELSTPALQKHLDEAETARRDADRRHGLGAAAAHAAPIATPAAAPTAPPADPPIATPASATPADGVPVAAPHADAPATPIAPPPAPEPPAPIAPEPAPTSRARATLPGFVPPTVTAAGDVVPAPAPAIPRTVTPVSGLHKLPRPGTGPIEVEPPPPGDGPIKAVVARAALAAADDRDAIFTLLLRALRSRARWAGLLTVQGGAAIGRLALAEDGLDVQSIGGVLLPLDTPSAFSVVLQTKLHHVGVLSTGDKDIDGMLARMGGVVPPAGLVLPIVLRGRVVAIAVAHNVERNLGLAQVAELLPLGQVVSDALGRLIVKHKSIGYRAPSSEPIPVIEIDRGEIPAKGDRRAAEWSVPAGAQPSVELDHSLEHGTEVSITAAPPGPIGEVLDAVEGDDERAAEAAMQEAIARAAEVLPLLGRRFPGRVRLDRHRVSERALRAAQYGGLLDLVVRLGSPVADLLVEKMGDSNRETRFYATVCTSELRPRNAIYALVERLFDADYTVRAVAIEALAGYPVRELDLAMVRCRHALHSDDPERVAAAAGAIAKLGDVHAMADLIDTVGRDGKRGEHARGALVALTRHDFGTSERKWRKWWDENRKRHRIEWLIDGLGSKDDAQRQQAIDDLRRLTGEYFGFHHDLPRKERDAAQARWKQWWIDVGRRRFVRDDDERNRPTAIVPRTPTK